MVLARSDARSPHMTSKSGPVEVSRAPAKSYAAGRMFWFTRKKLVGSYFLLVVARRS